NNLVGWSVGVVILIVVVAGLLLFLPSDFFSFSQQQVTVKELSFDSVVGEVSFVFSAKGINLSEIDLINPTILTSLSYEDLNNLEFSLLELEVNWNDNIIDDVGLQAINFNLMYYYALEMALRQKAVSEVEALYLDSTGEEACYYSDLMLNVWELKREKLELKDSQITALNEFVSFYPEEALTANLSSYDGFLDDETQALLEERDFIDAFKIACEEKYPTFPED
ncbi:MAG: hypothetical protein ABH821_02995, partial [archaeon]